MYYQQRPMDFWEGLLGGLAQGMLKRQEEKKQQQENKNTWDAYLAMKNAESQENIQPYQDYSNAAKENVFRANLVQDANKTAQANMAGLTNPDYLRNLGMTEDELAGYTPQISNTQQKFIAEQQAAAPKINEYAQAAGQVNTDATAALEQAKQRYSPAVFETLSPYIGKIPTETLINMAESLDKKRIEREEKAREKQEKIQAAEIIKQAAQSGLSDQQRIALYASNPYTMKIAEQMAGRSPQQPMHVAPGSYVQQGGQWVQVGKPTSGQLTEYQKYKIASGTAGKEKSEKLGTKEKWAQNYELNGLHSDQALIDEYNAVDEEGKAKLHKTAMAAMGRMNQYWEISSGGTYKPEQQEAQPQQPQQQATGKESRVINGNQYNALYKALTTEHGMSDADARQYLADNYTSA